MSQTSLIYLDYAATTPVAKEVADKMVNYLTFEGILVTPLHARMALAGKQKKLLKMHAYKSLKRLAPTQEKLFYFRGNRIR